jgi:TMEM175 potassium channel family protein
MKTERLNAFTDGVLAIVITIMVLELPTPEGNDLVSLNQIMPLFGAYLLSFINVGIFWSNHHHMLQAVGKVDGRVLWANNALLFPLTLVPFVIRWIGERGVTAWPVAAYGLVLVMAAAAYYLLERALIAAEGEESKVKAAVGSRHKEWLSLAGYSAGAILAFVSPYISVAIYAAVSAMWLVPDRRFERAA